jgi:peptide/nickel transport system substrate-binding protein
VSSQSRIAAGIAGALIAILAISGCTAQPAAKVKTTLTLAETPANLDISYNFLAAQYSYTDVFAIQATYDTLITEDPKTGQFMPWLARTWKLNADRTVMKMTLPANTKFADGTPLTADAVVKSFTAVADHKPSILFQDIQAYGVKFVSTGKLSFEIQTTRPIDQTFFVILNFVPVLAPKLVAHPKTASKTPDGTGPYTLDKSASTPGVQLTFKRNEHYWNLKAFPYKTIVLKAFQDNVAVLNALKTGQIDGGPIDSASVTEAKASGLNVAEAHGDYWSLFFNDRAGKVVPALADVRVRQAINMAFDKKGIAKQLDFGLGVVSSQGFIKGQPEYIKGANDFYKYDVAKAKSLLAEAGYPKGFAVTLPSLPMNSSVEPVIQQSLADIGIKVTWKKYTADQVVDPASKSPIFVWKNYYVNTIPTYIDPNALFNGSHYADPKAISMLHDISYGDAATSAQASQDLGQYLLDQAWFAPFSGPTTAWASRSGIKILLGPITAQRHLQNFIPVNK